MADQPSPLKPPPRRTNPKTCLICKLPFDVARRVERQAAAYHYQSIERHSECGHIIHYRSEGTGPPSK